MYIGDSKLRHRWKTTVMAVKLEAEIGISIVNKSDK